MVCAGCVLPVMDAWCGERCESGRKDRATLRAPSWWHYMGTPRYAEVGKSGGRYLTAIGCARQVKRDERSPASKGKTLTPGRRRTDW